MQTAGFFENKLFGSLLNELHIRSLRSSQWTDAAIFSAVIHPLDIFSADYTGDALPHLKHLHWVGCPMAEWLVFEVPLIS